VASFTQDQVRIRRRLFGKKLTGLAWGGNGWNLPTFGLLGRFERDPLPTLPLSRDARGFGPNDGVSSDERHERGGAELGCFLNDPVHSIAFQEGLSDRDSRTSAYWSVVLFQDLADKLVTVELGYLDQVPTASVISHPESLADSGTEACSYMVEQGTRDGRGPILHLV